MGDIGILRPVGYHTSGGNHPRIFALTPTGKFVVVANQVTGNVVVFKRNATTGLLEDTGIEIKVESASCVKIRQY
jgi:6-phosphogluconolactonase (cycloisomerase 2 family)